MDQESILSKFMEDPLTTSWWPWIIALLVGILTVIKTYMVGVECPSKERVDGKVVVITGASSGLGLETAKELAKRGAQIILACRDIEAGEAAAEIVRHGARDSNISVSHLDLLSFESIRNFVKNLDCEAIDILINNAGVVFHPEAKSKDGFEYHLQTNYLGPFLLTHLLLPRLQKGNARVINVSAVAHYAADLCMSNLNLQGCYSAREAFMQSKLALVMMTCTMAAKLKGTGVTVNSLHPGMVRGTKHMRHSPFSSSVVFKTPMLPWIWLLTKNPGQGAQTIIYLAVDPKFNEVTGKYYTDCEEREPSAKVNDEELMKTLYTKTCEMVGISGIKNK